MSSILSASMHKDIKEVTSLILDLSFSDEELPGEEQEGVTQILRVNDAVLLSAAFHFYPDYFFYQPNYENTPTVWLICDWFFWILSSLFSGFWSFRSFSIMLCTLPFPLFS
jgi:hypothetical protein